MFNILAALKRHLPAAAVMMLSVNFLAQVAQPSAAKDSEMKEGKLGQRKQHTKNVSYKLMTFVVGGILTPLSEWLTTATCQNLLVSEPTGIGY